MLSAGGTCSEGVAGSSLIVCLHSSVHDSAHRAVFERPPKGKRKIVLSTNIAETSVTIDDVVYVIDSGLLKEMRYDGLNKMSKLVTTWVSRAAADQRTGQL